LEKGDSMNRKNVPLYNVVKMMKKNMDFETKLKNIYKILNKNKKLSIGQMNENFINA